jgi:RimJ/RimL family protein N-acetyltransferase
MTTLLTERLVLQPLTALDSRELFAARGDREVMAFWDAPPDATHLETTSVLERLLAEMETGLLSIGPRDCRRMQASLEFAT